MGILETFILLPSVSVLPFLLRLWIFEQKDGNKARGKSKDL